MLWTSELVCIRRCCSLLGSLRNYEDHALDVWACVHLTLLQSVREIMELQRPCCRTFKPAAQSYAIDAAAVCWGCTELRRPCCLTSEHVATSCAFDAAAVCCGVYGTSKTMLSDTKARGNIVCIRRSRCLFGSLRNCEDHDVRRLSSR